MNYKMILKTITKMLILFCIGGLSYLCIELLYRSYTHISMFFVGGLCFIFVGLINELFPWDMALVSQMMISSILVTSIELVSGIILNCILKMNIWDYSNMPYNFLGQICLLFSFGWFFLSAVGILVDDWIRWKLFNEEKPRYKLF